MRLLTVIGLVLASGCSCHLDLFPDDEPYDECFDDSDCRDTDAVFCNGVGVCESRFLGPRQCVIRAPECFEGYCSASSDSCVPCTSPDDAPECFLLDRDAGTDAGGPDAGPSFCGLSPSAGERIGSWCVDGVCAPGLECLAENVVTLGPVERTMAEQCSMACDPSAEESGCPPCAACVDAIHVGDERVAVEEVGRTPYCALRCEPSQTWSGCLRGGFTCDPITGTCQESCRSDRECRLVRDASGAWVEDPTREDVCDPITHRCRLWGTLGARIGDACTTGTDCTIDGVCMRGGGWPDTGYCTRFDCQWPELACGEGELCHYREFDRPACTVACTVGAEPEEDRLGVGGHGAGCAPGLSCRWDGRSTDVTPSGGCVAGNYNAITTPNIGATCTRDDECYSPFGLGRCLWAESGTGTCSIVDCASNPAISCGAGASCASFGDDSYCLPTCGSASECAPGLACALAPTGSLVCAPSCVADEQCRAGERCDGFGCEFGGACRCAAS